MTDIFLLKLISELLSSDKPTADEIGVCKKIVKEMIESSNEKIIIPAGTIIPMDKNIGLLDQEAQIARKELIG